MTRRRRRRFSGSDYGTRRITPEQAEAILAIWRQVREEFAETDNVGWARNRILATKYLEGACDRRMLNLVQLNYEARNTGIPVDRWRNPMSLVL